MRCEEGFRGSRKEREPRWVRLGRLCRFGESGEVGTDTDDVDGNNIAPVAATTAEGEDTGGVGGALVTSVALLISGVRSSAIFVFDKGFPCLSLLFSPPAFLAELF